MAWFHRKTKLNTINISSFGNLKGKEKGHCTSCFGKTNLSLTRYQGLETGGNCVQGKYWFQINKLLIIV